MGSAMNTEQLETSHEPAAEDAGQFAHFDTAAWITFTVNGTELWVNAKTLWAQGLRPSRVAEWLVKKYALGSQDERPLDAMFALSMLGTPPNRYIFEDEGHC